ncbi:MAG TPA: hypothetical protein PK993_04075 [Clostridia bacterium]|nr:hypothetical protein [Clostridia bacterium]
MIIIESFSYVQSTRAKVIRGVKKNRTPETAIRGGNGSFLAGGTDPEINLNIKEEEDEYTVNYYPFFKENLQRNITKKYVTDVISKVIGKKYQNEAELDSAIIANM